MKLFVRMMQSITGKLLTFFLLSSIFIAFATLFFQSHVYLVSIEDEEQEYIGSFSDQIMASAKEDISVIENVLEQLSYDRLLYRDISELYGDSYMEIWESVYEIGGLIKLQKAMIQGIENIEIFHTNTTFCEDGGYLFIISEDAYVAQEFNKWEYQNGGYYTMSKPIRNLYNNVKAYIRITLNTNIYFGKYLHSENEFKGSYYILDQNSRVAASAGRRQFSIPGEEILEIIRTSESLYRDDETKMLYIAQEINGEWWLVTEMSVNGYSSSRMRSGVFIAAVLVIYCIICSILLQFFLHRIFSRLQKIGRRMEGIENRKLKKLNYGNREDEITRLEKQYNMMLATIDKTIEELAEIKIKKQKSEIQVLESQINPHFLYNSLSVMYWQAKESQNEELCSMIDNLTTFYRLSMSKGKGLIPVKQELEQIQAYIAIQQIRYDYVVEFCLHVEEEAKQILMPKMILQPLIENIYAHAAITLPGRRKIEVSIYLEEQELYLVVADNGSGMNEETLYNVNHNINMSEGHGIGISFIYNALEIYYNDRGSMVFTAKENEGTKVTIHFPKDAGSEKMEETL